MTTRTKTTRLAVARIAFGVGSCALVLAGATDANAFKDRRKSAGRSGNGYGAGAEFLKQGRMAAERHNPGSLHGDRRDHQPFSHELKPDAKNLRGFHGTMKNLRDRWVDRFRAAKDGVAKRFGKQPGLTNGRGARGSLASRILARIRDTGLEVSTEPTHAARVGIQRSADIRADGRSNRRMRRQRPIPGGKSSRLAFLGSALTKNFKRFGRSKTMLRAKGTFDAIVQRTAALKAKSGPSFRASRAALVERAQAELALLKNAMLRKRGVKQQDLQLCDDALCAL